MISCERASTANADQLYCLNIQQIRSKKVCWIHKYLTLFSYIRFDIKRDERGILIRTNATGAFKVVFRRSGTELKKNCPDGRALHDDVKCHIFNKTVQRLPQSKLIESGLVQISIFLFYPWLAIVLYDSAILSRFDRKYKLESCGCRHCYMLYICNILRGINRIGIMQIDLLL